jgi:hypothetical protein
MKQLKPAERLIIAADFRPKENHYEEIAEATS